MVISQLTVCSYPLINIDTSHPPLLFGLAVECSENLQPKRDARFHFYKADYDKILGALNSIDWAEVFTECPNVDDMVGSFYERKSLITKHVPKYEPRNMSKYPIWFSAALISNLKEKYKYRNKYRKYGNPRDQLTFEMLRERCAALHSLNYNNYLNNLESSLKSNPKLIWSYVRQKRGNSTNYPAQMSSADKVVDNGPDICELFASQFSSIYNTDNIAIPKESHVPTVTNTLTAFSVTTTQVYRVLKRLDVTKGAGSDGIPSIFVVRCASALALPMSLIINKSLHSGAFPEIWKESLVLPLFKSGDPSTVKNYRPISLIPVFAKVFEMLVCPVLAWHLRHIIISEQHGFVRARSTASNLVSFVEDLAEDVDHGHSLDAVYTDFSKAFDKVNHNLLIHKLHESGLGGTLLSWCKSYLTNRKSIVVVGGYSSRPFLTLSGVPQGSHLGPLFFILFINDIHKCFENSKFYMFADDLKFFRQVNSTHEAQLLQFDLDRLAMWCQLNGMSLNIDKCHVIRFTRKKITTPRTYYINGMPLADVDHIRDLGVIIDSKLRFNLHIDHVVKKSFKTLGFVLRNCKAFKKPTTKIAIYNAFVRSTLEYCSVVWNPHYDIYNKRLESVQKRFLWHLSYSCNLAKKLPSYDDRLQHFCLQSLHSRRKLLDGMFFFKLFNSLTDTPYLLSKLNISVPRNLSRQCKKYKPFAVTAACSNLGHYSPLNRLISTYNAMHNAKIVTISECGVKIQHEIDVFSGRMHNYKSSIGLSLSVA